VTTDATKKQILEIIQEVLTELDRGDIDVSNWETSNSLYDYLASSMLVVEVIVGIEDEFNIQFPSDDLSKTNQITIDQIIAFIEQQTQAT